MITITKKHRIPVQRGKYNSHIPHMEYEQRVTQSVFIKEEFRSGIGTVAIFYEEGEYKEVITKPTKNYVFCSRLIDKIFKEKCRRVSPVIDKQNIRKHVA